MLCVEVQVASGALRIFSRPSGRAASASPHAWDADEETTTTHLVAQVSACGARQPQQQSPVPGHTRRLPSSPARARLAKLLCLAHGILQQQKQHKEGLPSQQVAVASLSAPEAALAAGSPAETPLQDLEDAGQTAGLLDSFLQLGQVR